MARIRIQCHMTGLEEQTRVMRRQVAQEKQLPPADLEKRKPQYNFWRKKAGWIN